MDYSEKMKNEIDQRKVTIMKYRPEVELLVKYIPWVEEITNSAVMSEYNGSGTQAVSFSFPVYDSTLMGLVKTAQQTGLMDRNYKYIYSRNRIRSEVDEHNLIAKATLKDLGVLCGILSHYVLGGMTKGSLWPEGVTNGVLLALLCKLKQLVVDPVIE